MEESKSLNLHKAIPAIILAVILILMVGIAVNGWQQKNYGENSGEDGILTDNTDNPNGDTDENEGTADNNTSDTKEDDKTQKEPELKFYLTGLEASEDEYLNNPYAIVCDYGAPLYGISGAELVIEIPIEDGKTRLVVYNTDASLLGKLGALMPTRDYISTITKFFGGILVARGDDDIVSYKSISSTLHIDMSKHLEYCYIENGKSFYTDGTNLDVVKNIESIDSTLYKNSEMPFDFCEYFDKIELNGTASKVTLPYADGYETVLFYDRENGRYTLQKGGKNKVDMLDGKTASFVNAFILFADSMTYEKSSGTETVIETATSGGGYYISGGGVIEIRWSVDEKNQLIFKTLNGDKLTVNRGESYIAYYKSSDSQSVVFE